MIDSHTHLEFCEPPDAELVKNATDAGVSRLVTVGTTSVTCRQALRAAEDFPQVYAAIGRHPNEASGFDDADLAELKALADHERCVAIGETGLDYYRDYAPRADQERAFIAQIELARETGKPLVIHTRNAEDDTLRMLREHAQGVKVILHCFTMAARSTSAWRTMTGGSRSPATSPIRSPKTLRAAALRIPARQAAGRDGRAVPLAAARPRQAQRAGQRRPHGAGAGRRAARALRGARGGASAQRRRRVRMVKPSARTSSSTATSST